MDERRTCHVTILGAETQLAAELEVALQRQDGSRRFVVASKPGPNGLERGESELLIIDVDGQANRRLELLAECRALCPDLPVIVLVERGDTSGAVGALKAGAADCLEKPLEAERLRSAVAEVLGNGISSGPRTHGSLTRMEIQVLHLLLSGRTNLEIAEQFHRSPRTVEVHRRNIMRKLGASSVSGLVREAARMGLIGREPRGPAPRGDGLRSAASSERLHAL